MAGFPKNQPGTKAKKPRPGIAFDKKQISQLIKQLHGNVSRVADAVGASRGGLRRFIDNHADLQEELAQSRERQLDELEQTVFDRAIETKDTTLQLFLLKTQGKKRGYDQSEAQQAAREVANAAFDFILAKNK